MSGNSTTNTQADTQADTPPSGHDHRFADLKLSSAWVAHPIDIRVSIPFVHKRIYFTVVAGQERRRADRLHHDRTTYPLVTAGNVMFSLGVTTLLLIAALSLLIAQSAIIE